MVAQSSSAESTSPEMVLIQNGTYEPLYSVPGSDGEESKSVHVSAFYLSVDPVTNGQFLEFVRENTRWRRSNVSRLFADEAYLIHWKDDLDFGSDAQRIADQPVTNVSWFAAKAYAEWTGARLPTLAEWEYVGAAGQLSAVGLNEDGYKEGILARVTAPSTRGLANVVDGRRNYWGVRGLHGVIWEWVSDFNAALITGESRGDSSLERKLYCGSGVVGASDFTDYAAFLRFAFRGSLKASYSIESLGFRTAKDVLDGEF